MKNANEGVFARLRAMLDETERWLDRHFADPSNPAERDLASRLRRYIRHCRRDPEKWASPAAAERTMNKLDQAWLTLYRVRGGRK